MTIENPVIINDKEYKFEDLPPEGQKMVVYLQKIDAQLGQLSSQMELIQMSREVCYSRLNAALEKPDSKAA